MRTKLLSSLLLSSLLEISLVKGKTHCEIFRDIINEITNKQTDFELKEPWDCCNLPYVGCSSDPEMAITNIVFDQEMIPIVNQIPESLTNINTITRIGITNIQNENFKIPNFFGQLEKLDTLEIAKNRVSPELPNICEIKNLETLYLSDNNLKGPFPECIGQLTKMKALYIKNNSVNGNIPDTIGNLVQLETLELTNDLMVGTIPSSLDKLNKLVTLNLSGNSFTGDIPTNIGNIKNLETFDISHNKFDGLIPNSIEELKKLKYFDISYNRILGVPDFTIKFPELQYLNIDNSGLYGIIPYYPDTVTTCKFDKVNYCVEKKPSCTQIEIECTQEFLNNLEKFKEYQENYKKNKEVKEKNDDDDSTPTSKYILALIIILVPLVGIAIFLRVYNIYHKRKEDDLVVKQIDYINSKHTYFSSDLRDVNSDTGSDAQLLVAPEHRKLNKYGTQSLPRSIFNDTDDDDDLDQIEREMIKRAMDENIKANRNNNISSNNQTLQFKTNTSQGQLDYNISSPYFN